MREHHGLIRRLLAELRGARSIARMRAQQIKHLEGENAEALLAARLAIARAERLEEDRNAYRTQGMSLNQELEYRHREVVAAPPKPTEPENLLYTSTGVPMLASEFRAWVDRRWWRRWLLRRSWRTV